MKLKGLADLIKRTRKLQDKVNEQLDELEGHEEKFERLNDVWMQLEFSIENLEDINNI